MGQKETGELLKKFVQVMEKTNQKKDILTHLLKKGSELSNTKDPDIMYVGFALYDFIALRDFYNKNKEELKKSIEYYKPDED